MMFSKGLEDNVVEKAVRDLMVQSRKVNPRPTRSNRVDFPHGGAFVLINPKNPAKDAVFPLNSGSVVAIPVFSPVVIIVDVYPEPSKDKKEKEEE